MRMRGGKISLKLRYLFVKSQQFIYLFYKLLIFNWFLNNRMVFSCYNTICRPILLVEHFTSCQKADFEFIIYLFHFLIQFKTIHCWHFYVKKHEIIQIRLKII